jgi:nitrate reductase gamma subunit
MNKVMDVALFEIFPYVTVVIFFLESIRRYRQRRFTFSSLSSQFLERDQLFVGTVPFHFGIMLILAGHLIAFLFPRQVLTWNSVPIRLYVLETTAMAAGLSTLIGMVNLIVRRLRYSRVRAVTSRMDGVILGVLLVQVSLGVYIAMNLRWGSSWFAVALTPYLRSLIMLQPDLTLLSPLPLVVKLHIFGMFLFLLLLSYSRLVHLLVVPWQYIWRPPQVVIWNHEPTIGVRSSVLGVRAGSVGSVGSVRTPSTEHLTPSTERGELTISGKREHK